MDLLVVSSYPTKGTTHSDKTVGGASYTKTLLSAIKKLYPTLAINILAERFTTKEERYDEQDIHIQRAWKRGNAISIAKSILSLLNHPGKIVLVSFEASMFGTPFDTCIAIFSLIFLRLSGKKNSIILHQVPNTFDEIEQNKTKLILLTLQKKILYFLINLASTHIIVFEEQFKKYLAKQDKVIVIPHFIPSVSMRSKKDARTKLNLNQNDFYVLYFGYLSPYKGVDLLLESWSSSKTNAKLIVAGGMNPNYEKNKDHNAFVGKVKTLATQKNITITGFVPETDISDFFSAADIVILPYKIFMSSSGPLSFAFAFERGVLLSNSLKGYFVSPDISLALKEAGINEKDILYLPESQDIMRAINWAKSHNSQLTQFSRIMKQKRNIENIAKKFYTHLSQYE